MDGRDSEQIPPDAGASRLRGAVILATILAGLSMLALELLVAGYVFELAWLPGRLFIPLFLVVCFATPIVALLSILASIYLASRRDGRDQNALTSMSLNLLVFLIWFVIWYYIKPLLWR